MPATVMYNNSAIAIVDNLATLQTSRTILPYDIIVTDISDSVLGVSEYIVKYIDRTIESIPSSIATPIITIGSQAFDYCYSLISVSFPNATKINNEAFGHCYSLTTVYMPNVSVIQMSAFLCCSNITSLTYDIFPKLQTIGSSAFWGCRSLSTIDLPVLTIEPGAFSDCSALTIVSLPNLLTINHGAFSGCSSLSAFYLPGPNRVSIITGDPFIRTPMSNSAYLGYFGSIYVPSSLIDSYKTADRWSLYSNRFVSI